MSLLAELLRFLVVSATAFLGWLVSLVSGWAVVALGAVLGVLSGWALVVALFVAAVVLNLLGVEDVFSVLDRRVSGDEGTDTDPLEAVRSVSAEVMTDEAGRFSPEAFERATGISPAEFVLLFVKSSGGRCKQKTIATCLPWSKSTVSRLLDSLEDEGLLERVTVGRENVVCTPEAAPDREGGGSATPSEA